MSRFVENLVVIGIAILMACLGLKLGRTEGRAEMKHWQDEWYAAHPAVKEVPTTPTFNGGASVYIVKPGEKCAVISFDQIHYNVDCEPPPPKPQKGSKRFQFQICQRATDVNGNEIGPQYCNLQPAGLPAEKP